MTSATMRTLSALAVALALARPHDVSLGAVGQDRNGLRIVVVAGEDAVNIIQQRTAVAPVVEVRDENDQPVAGVVVRFAVRAGRGGTANGLSALSATTNAAGRATVPAFAPTTAGPLQIEVTAVNGSQTATATINQMSYRTAAEASRAQATQATRPERPGRSKAKWLGATAAVAAAGGATTYALSRERRPDPTINRFAPTWPYGVAGLTQFSFSLEVWNHSGNGLEVRWDLGDGTTLNGWGPPSHVYANPGTYTATVTVVDSNLSLRASTTVPVYGLTGTWTSDEGIVLLLEQAGQQLRGQSVGPRWPTCAVSGEVTSSFPPFSLGINQPNCRLSGGQGVGSVTYALSVSGDGRTLTGTLVESSPPGTAQVTLRRP